jgi:hypothetical protein
VTPMAGVLNGACFPSKKKAVLYGTLIACVLTPQQHRTSVSQTLSVGRAV